MPSGGLQSILHCATPLLLAATPLDSPAIRGRSPRSNAVLGMRIHCPNSARSRSVHRMRSSPDRESGPRYKSLAGQPLRYLLAQDLDGGGHRGITAGFVFHVGISPVGVLSQHMVSGVVQVADHQRWLAWPQPRTSGMQLNGECIRASAGCRDRAGMCPVRSDISSGSSKLIAAASHTTRLHQIGFHSRVGPEPRVGKTSRRRAFRSAGQNSLATPGNHGDCPAQRLAHERVRYRVAPSGIHNAARTGTEGGLESR
jgi:hypothetical protein